MSGIILLAAACMLPWVEIVSRNIVVTGLESAGTNYGKPGLVNLIMSGFALIFFMIPRIWAKRTNLFFCAFNLAWSIRNFIIVSTCHGGECPEKQTGLYLLLLASVIMLIAALFPDMELKEDQP